MSAGCRELTIEELDLVAGGRYIPGWGWEVSGSQGNSNNWALGSMVAGTFAGMGFGAEVTEGIGAAVEAGIVGGEVGSVAGPIGTAAGVAFGVTFAVVSYNYGPDISRGLANLM